MCQPAKTAVLLCFSFLLCCSFFACTTGSPSDHSKKKYSIYILGKDNKEYLLQTNSLDSGVLYPEKTGAYINKGEMDRDVIVKDGCYYFLNRKKAKLIKYTVADQQLQEAGAVAASDFSIENFRWMGKDTLLITGLDGRNYAQVKYLLLETTKMKLISTGNMDIPLPSGKFSSMSIGFVEPHQQQLLVGYTYHENFSPSSYTTSDTLYVSSLSYPQMKSLHTDKETRSTYPGGMNTIQSYSFYDEKKDFYFMTCPGIALGNRPELATGIFRIKDGERATDKQYFFDLSAAIHNHSYGMWYLGNHKAMVRSERKDLFKGLSDHYSTAHFEFYVADLQKETVQKLDLPLDKGTRRECVIVKGDVAWIAVNSSTKGNYIWRYHISTGKLEKGLQLAGDTDFIMRIDQFYP